MANIGKVVVSALCVSLLFAGVAGVKELKEAFEANPPKVIESAKLTFKGVDEGYDVYNCSIPFTWGGVEYIFGRVEPHDKWASSVTMLFRKTGRDEWTRVLEFGKLELEDPYIQYIRGELIVGGTRVMKVSGRVATYRGAFYRDNKRGPMHLEYFTTGPERMKDIRLVELKDGRIGVFSRPRGEDVRKKYGSESVIGFTTVKDLDELTPEVIEKAPVIEGVFGKDEWGGCNQAYLMDDGKVLVAGHLWTTACSLLDSCSTTTGLATYTRDCATPLKAASAWIPRTSNEKGVIRCYRFFLPSARTAIRCRFPTCPSA